MNDSSLNKSGFLWACFLLILAHLWSRYAAAPVVDFSGDSWGFLAIGLNNSGWIEALGLFLNEADRPVQAVLITMLFHWLGDFPLGYAVFSMMGYALHFALSLAVVQKIAKDHAVTFIFGMIYVVLPNVSESFQWGAMIGVLYMQVFYMLSALLWVMYTERGNILFAIFSALLYIAAVASYEFGILLPAVFLLLVPVRDWKRVLPGLIPFILLGVLYLTWRFTGGFGQAEGLHFTQRQPTLEPWALKENGLNIVSWWIGPLMASSVLKGLNAFSHIPGGLKILLLLGNSFAILYMLKLVSKVICTGSEQDEVSYGSAMVFALAWFAAGNALSLISWTAPRLNFFPAFGAIFFLALLLRKIPFARWAGSVAVVMFLCFCANQGNSQAWKEVGIFNRNLYTYLETHKEEWKDCEVVFFDYEAVVQRVTPGLLNSPSSQPLVWAYYENATLLRGFVLDAMLGLLSRGDSSRPMVAFSTIENGAKISGNQLKWYLKYREQESRETDLDKVFTVDCYQVGLGNR